MNTGSTLVRINFQKNVIIPLSLTIPNGSHVNMFIVVNVF